MGTATPASFQPDGWFSHHLLANEADVVLSVCVVGEKDFSCLQLCVWVWALVPCPVSQLCGSKLWCTFNQGTAISVVAQVCAVARYPSWLS